MPHHRVKENGTGAAGGAGPEVAPAFAGEGLMRLAALSEQSFPAGALYILGLPIGNAADITLRALWLLSIADAVACEDTRETARILARYGLRKTLLSAREHNEARAGELILARLARGERVALVSDAGTPAISDPGARVARAARAAGHPVVPLPGASALTTAVSVAGLAEGGFRFVGFLPPRARAREEALRRLCADAEAFVLYEAPHRILSLLDELARRLAPERRLLLAREMTKRFEEYVALTAAEIPAWRAGHQPRGEYVIVVDRAAPSAGSAADGEALRWARALAAELPLSRAAALAAALSGASRDEIYQALTRERANGAEPGGA